MTKPPLVSPVLLAASLAAVLATACSGGSGGSKPDISVPLSTPHGASAGTPVVIHGRWLAYMADEGSTGPGGTDFNGNGSFQDSIPVVTDVSTQSVRVLNVQASDMALISNSGGGSHLYTVTDESVDLVDWNFDGALDDVVLLHTALNQATPVAYLATLDPSGPCRILTVDDRLYFAEDSLGLVAPETSLMVVTPQTATAPVPVFNADALFTLRPRLMAVDEGLIFLTLDETVEGRVLNTNASSGDNDMVDTDVLALLDGTDPSAAIVTVPYALRDDSTPVRALSTGAGDWLVGFLVDETNDGENVNEPPGGVNLNAPGLFPPEWWPPQCQFPVCSGCNDVDTLDQVLHWLDFSAFLTNPTVNAPTNTGLVGHDRVLAFPAGGTFFVATVSAEADEGLCSLNLDGEQGDQVLRWVEAASPSLPSPLAHAAATGVAGGAMGNTEFGGILVSIISEAGDNVDHDGDGNIDRDLIAWVDPTDPLAVFQFDHFNPGTLPINSVATAWMGGPDGLGQVPVGFPEAFSLIGDLNGDGDVDDTLPTYLVFNGTQLGFSGPAVAVVEDNAGIGVAAGMSFYRVDEAADSRDWNGDGDMNDAVLCRTDPGSLAQNFYVGTLNAVQGPAVFPPAPGFVAIAVAFLTDETMDLIDHNGDGDTTDLVLRWIRVD